MFLAHFITLGWIAKEYSSFPKLLKYEFYLFRRYADAKRSG